MQVGRLLGAADDSPPAEPVPATGPQSDRTGQSGTGQSGTGQSGTGQSGTGQSGARRGSARGAFARGGRLRTLAWWLLSRGITVGLLWVHGLNEKTVFGDVRYYARTLHTLTHGGSLSTAFREYPPPVLGILAPQYLLSGGRMSVYLVVYPASMLALDAAFCYALWRRAGRRHSDGLTFWLWFAPAIGPIAYFRFDLVPAALCGFALLSLARRPLLAGLSLGVGAAIKLWPLVGLPILLLRGTRRRALVAGFAASAGALLVASLALTGWRRTTSALSWQSDRGLQIESVTATPVMLLRAVDPRGWRVAYTKYQSTEIFGPGVSRLLTVSDLLAVAGIALLVWLWWRAHRLRTVTVESVGWLLLTAAVTVTIVNKTFSPQYLLWVGGALAALLALARRDRTARLAAVLLLLICGLTQLEYPILYTSLVQHAGVTPTLVLATRNALLIVLLAICVHHLWRQTRLRRPVRTVPRQLNAQRDRAGGAR